jgi:hypothetical protein
MKILNSIIWFFIHAENSYELNKTYFKDLNYYEYTLYQRYKIFCLISFKWRLEAFHGKESLTYHNLVDKLKPIHQNGGYDVLEKLKTI